MTNKIVFHVDRSRETIIWKSIRQNSEKDIIHIEMAGTTHPDKNYAIKRSRRNGARTGFDYLYVIEYVVSGVGYIEAESKSARVEAGDLYIIRPRSTHAYYADKQQPFEKKWINVSGMFLNAMESVFLGDEPFNVVHIGENGEKIMDNIHRCLVENIDINDTNNKIIKLLLDMFLLINERKRAEMGELSLFDRIVEYIDVNIGKNLTVGAIAERFFTSPSTLYRMFTSECGMSPKEYIMSRKIQAAKRMIAANDTTFNTIASTLGFYDSHHFFRSFRTVTGMSPTEYRKKVLENEE